MKRHHLFAILLTALLGLVFADTASAMYHPGLGRHLQRDPNGTAIAPAMRVGSGPAMAGGGFIPRDHNPHQQYADGMNLYQYVQSSPLMRNDPLGLCSDDRCGPDITTELKRLAIILEGRFRMLSDTRKDSVCDQIYSAGGWDITSLAAGTVSTPDCPGSKCKGTVTVEGRCWNQSQVNYFLWGQANRLCGYSFIRAQTAKTIWKWWQYGHTGTEAGIWTANGYYYYAGNPWIDEYGGDGSASRSDCKPCDTQYGGRLHGNVGGMAF